MARMRAQPSTQRTLKFCHQARAKRVAAVFAVAAVGVPACPAGVAEAAGRLLAADHTPQADRDLYDRFLAEAKGNVK